MLTALLFIYKLILKALDFILHIIAYVMIFLGAYFPFFYLIYGFIISVTFDFALFNTTTLYSRLYIWGLTLSCVAMLIIAIRNIILKPTSKLKTYFEKPQQSLENNHTIKKRDKHTKEQPLIYRSRKYPNIIVHEYQDYFDLYEDKNGKIVKIRTEYKRNYEK